MRQDPSGHGGKPDSSEQPWPGAAHGKQSRHQHGRNVDVTGVRPFAAASHRGSPDGRPESDTVWQCGLVPCLQGEWTCSRNLSPPSGQQARRQGLQ